jgi:hypothetical protein
MSRSTVDEIHDFHEIVFGDSYDARRRRRLEDANDRVQTEVHALEDALYAEIRRTQGMIVALAEVLADRGVIDRKALAGKLAEPGRAARQATAAAFDATKRSSNACDACGAEVTPSNSYLRGDRRLCSSCYESE